jgi:hypothetical protein
LAEAVFREVRVVNFNEDLLKLEFPKELASYADFTKNSKHVEELNKVLKERFGVRPSIEFHIAGADGPASTVASAKAPAEGANVGASPARDQAPLSPDVVEVDPEEAPLREVESRDAGAAPEREAGPGVAGSGEEADSIIQDPREVLAIALDLFGPAGGVAGDKRNEGG